MNQLEKIALSTIAAVTLAVISYNVKPITEGLKGTYNRESLAQLGADLTRASEINKYGCINP